MTSRPVVAVNATALSSSGGLTILQQFLNYIQKDNRYRYIIFVSNAAALPHSENYELIEIKAASLLSRIKWDWFGFSEYLKKHAIQPHKIISLQNTSIQSEFEQIIYLHNAIPFDSAVWKYIKTRDLKFLFYRFVYAYFIYKFVSEKTVIVVQTEWMKSIVLKKCPKLHEKNIKVIVPGIDVLESPRENANKDLKSLLYPATPLFYKNHDIILKALKQLVDKSVDIPFCFSVTFAKGDFLVFDKLVEKYQLSQYINYLGMLERKSVLSVYLDAHLIVYPSSVESFGLPLAESALLGKKIICTDLPYAREVLNGYSNVTFVESDNIHAWATTIQNNLSVDNDDEQTKCDNAIFLESFKDTSGWRKFIELI